MAVAVTLSAGHVTIAVIDGAIAVAMVTGCYRAAVVHLETPEEAREMHGVTVSTSAFLACHQCYCADSSLAWGFNLRASVCGIF